MVHGNPAGQARSSDSLCTAVKLPKVFWVGGYYPLEYSIRYRVSRDDDTVSLENFVLHEAE